jgi:hypothetical protein
MRMNLIGLFEELICQENKMLDIVKEWLHCEIISGLK